MQNMPLKRITRPYKAILKRKISPLCKRYAGSRQVASDYETFMNRRTVLDKLPRLVILLLLRWRTIYFNRTYVRYFFLIILSQYNYIIIIFPEFVKGNFTISLFSSQIKYCVDYVKPLDTQGGFMI